MQVPNRFQPPPRLLMGPGPSNVALSVLEAMSRPLVGHLDPVFVKMMEEIKAMLRQVFLTKNEMTFPVSGTGSAGMEFCCVNLIEPGDEVVIGVNGVFGARMVAVVHAETSTGALTPVVEISKQAHDAGALFLLDAVTSLGGCPVRIDDWE